MSGGVFDFVADVFEAGALELAQHFEDAGLDPADGIRVAILKVKRAREAALSGLPEEREGCP